MKHGFMNETAICDRLIKKGLEIFEAEKKPNNYTDESEANDLLNDLEKHPHAFVLACVMDRQVPAEKAWIIPYRFKKKLLGDFSMDRLNKLSLSEISNIMSNPPLHRFIEIMSKAFYSAIQHINKRYASDASRIWKGNPSSAEVVYRFLEFEGVGPKIATMAANILAREYKIPFSDYYSIDISADVHIRKVFMRLGLIEDDSSSERATKKAIYKARALYPKFPGLMDLPCWEIGRKWCRPQEADSECHECFMNDLCPTAKRNAAAK
jgi:endonuclease III